MRLYKHRIKDPYISPKATSSHTIRLQAQHQKKYKRSSRCAMWEQILAPISKSVDCWECWSIHHRLLGFTWTSCRKGAGIGASTGKRASQSLYPEPGSSLVNVCQRSIFLSLFFRQSNQCFSLSPLAFIPKETPPGERVEMFIKTAKKNTHVNGSP